MDDLIYNFLLQSGYPRSSIVLNIEIGPETDDGYDEDAPAFIIAEPETADVLAVIGVTTSIDDDSLELKASDVSYYARMFAEDSALGFLFCVDPYGNTEQEQVKVYRVLRNSDVQLLSMQNFPDFTALRVSRKLAIKTSGVANQPFPESLHSVETQTVPSVDAHESNFFSAVAAYFYLPALILLMAIVADRLCMMYIGVSLLTTAQSVLTIGAAFLFSLPPAIRCIEQALVKISINNQS